MSQYVFTMTSRMVAITVTCLVLLCVLLFVMGVEIGKLLAPVAPVAPAVAAPAVAPPAPSPSTPAAAPTPPASTP
ncbi:hypothetical protein [Variovorax sp. GB1P17]|uniref:hypothetical protein n=1 Tax=Variovorax sp. GB1P17 TaxID=3443740 RepID=UPI003F470C98